MGTLLFTYRPPAVLEAWAVYHRLRQLLPPLLDVEEERRRAYRTLPLRGRLAQLAEQDPRAAGSLGAYLDVNWPELVEALETAYRLLLRRAEPAKFYGLATVVTEHLEGSGAANALEGASDSSLRVVVPTEHEANLLLALMGDLVNGWTEALQDGTVTLSTARETKRISARSFPRLSLNSVLSEVSRPMTTYGFMPSASASSSCDMKTLSLAAARFAPSTFIDTPS